VNHCVNDIFVQGARPLFFLDYVATGRSIPHVVATVVEGIARGCKEHGCALLGGETAEMPDFYAAGELDVAGIIVGIVDRRKIVDGQGSRPGTSSSDCRPPGCTRTAIRSRAQVLLER
jgi:phosphoribosylformylglycinamidine cyclo-ligase